VLAAAGVLRVAQDDVGLTLAFVDGTAWASHALLGAAPWALLSLALRRANAPVRAALVVFAELALETEAVWDAQAPVGAAAVAATASVPHTWIELTLKELSHRVG